MGGNPQKTLPRRLYQGRMLRTALQHEGGTEKEKENWVTWFGSDETHLFAYGVLIDWRELLDETTAQERPPGCHG